MTLDYYLIAGAVPAGAPECVVIEEFAFDGDHCAVGLDTAGWSVNERRWWSSAEFGRGMRDDPRLRERVVAVDRAGAADAFRDCGGRELPDETVLRSHFRDRAPLRPAPPLRLDDAVPDGYREQWLHRVLFAGDPEPGGLEALRSSWGAARLAIDDDLYAWELRRIRNVAWCLDLTTWLASGGGAVGPLLREMTGQARRQGLIPVTVERLR